MAINIFIPVFYCFYCVWCKTERARDPNGKRKANGQSVDWYENYNKPWGLKLGLECCASSSVAFHYVKPDLMPHLSALLFDCRAR